MADESQWRTKSIPLQGGTRFDIVPVLRDASAPGSLIDSQNFQSGDLGGYARIKGYAKYDTNAVSGSGPILGSFVFNDGVLACRGSDIYFSTGSGWGSAINPSARTSAGFYRASKYSWSDTKIVLVDGVNDPVRFVGTTGTDLTNAPAGATCVSEFKNHLFFGKDSSLYWSAPNDDTDYLVASGGGLIVVGDNIVNIKAWRGELYIFCSRSIVKLTGNDASDFAISTVTKDIGCPWPDTIQEIAGDLVFLGPDGLRPVSGTDRVGDINIACFSNPVKSYILEQMAIYKSERIVSMVIADDSQYRLLFNRAADTSSPGLNACLTNGANGLSWEFFKTSGIQASCTDQGVISSGVDPLIVHGSYDGYVYKDNYGDSFDGANIVAFIKLPYLVFDDPRLRKTLYKLKIYLQAEDDANVSLVAQVTFDDNDLDVIQPASVGIVNSMGSLVAIYGGTSLYGTAIYGQGGSTNYRTNLIGSGFNASITISSANTLPQYTLRTLIIDYTMEARQ